MRTRRGRRDEQQEESDVDENEESGDANSSSSEDEGEDYNDSDEEDDEYLTDDDEEESKLIQTKTILFLCQEGQIRLAWQRLQMLQERNQLETLKKEIFQMGHDKNYPLHEVIMGGTLENSSKNMIPEILQVGKQWKGPYLVMLNAQPPSHGRTALHWAAWGNASLDIMREIAMANPEALILRDNKTHGARTPLEIFQRYHTVKPGNLWHEWSVKKKTFLETSTHLWTQHRVRLAVYKATLHWFRHYKPDKDDVAMVPFDKKGRKEAGITPKNWFSLSVLGYCLQREMEPLLWRILGFVGGKAQITKGNNRKRRRT